MTLKKYFSFYLYSQHRASTPKQTDEEKMLEDGWEVSKKLRITSPPLEPKGIPRHVPLGSTPLGCFQAMWSDNIITHIVDKMNAKMEKNGLPGKQVSGQLTFHTH